MLALRGMLLLSLALLGCSGGDGSAPLHASVISGVQLWTLAAGFQAQVTMVPATQGMDAACSHSETEKLTAVFKLSNAEEIARRFGSNKIGTRKVVGLETRMYPKCSEILLDGRGLETHQKLSLVAAHEFGHALGAAHLGTANQAVMAPDYDAMGNCVTAADLKAAGIWRGKRVCYADVADLSGDVWESDTWLVVKLPE